MFRGFLSFALLVVVAGFSLSWGQVAQAQDAKAWTILVFLNADNNLHNAGLDDLTEMEAVGSTADVNIVVQFDGKNIGDSRRYYIEKGRRIEKYRFPENAPTGEVDMGSTQSLIDFAKWGIQNYPAERYFLAVWDHGSGWLKNHATGMVRLRDGAQLQGISYDDDSENHMSTPGLAYALEEISRELERPLDIYGSDACLMGMVEVAYELAPYAKVVVGAESTEPFDGWPYDDFLTQLVADPNMSTDQVASILVDVYGTSYDGGSQGSASTTLSAIRTDFLPHFMDYTQIMFEELLTALDTQAASIKGAAKQTTRFDYKDNADLADFFARASGFLNRGLFSEAFGSWWDLYHNYLLINSVEVGTTFNGAKGLAIWLPRYASTLGMRRSDYAELRFAQETSWLDFLEEFHGRSD